MCPWESKWGVENMRINCGERQIMSLEFSKGTTPQEGPMDVWKGVKKIRGRFEEPQAIYKLFCTVISWMRQ